MQDTRWDHALKVTGGGTGLVGYAAAVPFPILGPGGWSRTHKVHSLPAVRHEIPAHGYWNDTRSLSSPSTLNSGG